MTRMLKDHGVQCMFVGYMKDHAGDIYHMWDPNTNGIHETHDIIWLRRMFFKKLKPTYKVVAPIEFDADDLNGNKEAGDNFDNFGVREGENEDDDKSEIANTEQANMVDEEEGPLNDVQVDKGIITRSGRVVISKPMRLIEEMGACSYEISLSAVEQEYYNTMWKINEMALVASEHAKTCFSNNSVLFFSYF